MLTYDQANTLYASARYCSTIGKIACKLENNTYLIKTTIGYGVQLHNTVIVELLPNSMYILETGGYYTRTTKERINTYAPITIRQSKGDWYYMGFDWEREFYTGIVIREINEGTYTCGPSDMVPEIEELYEDATIDLDSNTDIDTYSNTVYPPLELVK